MKEKPRNPKEPLFDKTLFQEMMKTYNYIFALLLFQTAGIYCNMPQSLFKVRVRGNAGKGENTADGITGE